MCDSESVILWCSELLHSAVTHSPDVNTAMNDATFKILKLGCILNVNWVFLNNNYLQLYEMCFKIENITAH